MAFVHVPAMIFASADDRDFFVVYLANVTNPEIVRHRIEAQSPRLTETLRPDLFSHLRVRVSEKGIRCRDRVGEPRGAAVDIDAKNRAKQKAAILGVTFRVLLWPTVANANIKKAIRTENHQPRPCGRRSIS